MSVVVKTVFGLEQASEFPGDDFRGAVLFVWIGLTVALIAASTGEQGVWL